MKTNKKLVVLKANDNVSILFSEWFDRTYGNTYYDADVSVKGRTHRIAFKYGYNAGDTQSINEALASAGYRVRVNNKNRWAPYKNITINKRAVLKRELNK